MCNCRYILTSAEPVCAVNGWNKAGFFTLMHTNPKFSQWEAQTKPCQRLVFNFAIAKFRHVSLTTTKRQMQRNIKIIVKKKL